MWNRLFNEQDIQNHLNGKKRVTKTQFIDSLCNDSDLADDIKSVLEEGVM